MESAKPDLHFQVLSKMSSCNKSCKTSKFTWLGEFKMLIFLCYVLGRQQLFHDNVQIQGTTLLKHSWNIPTI